MHIQCAFVPDKTGMRVVGYNMSMSNQDYCNYIAEKYDGKAIVLTQYVEHLEDLFKNN